MCFEADSGFRASQGSTDGFDCLESRERAEGFDVRARPGAAFEHEGASRFVEVLILTPIRVIEQIMLVMLDEFGGEYVIPCSLEVLRGGTGYDYG